MPRRVSLYAVDCTFYGNSFKSCCPVSQYGHVRIAIIISFCDFRVCVFPDLLSTTTLWLATRQRNPSLNAKVSKVLVLGSGGLSIGQAGEFDYSGSQVTFHLFKFYCSLMCFLALRLDEIEGIDCDVNSNVGVCDTTVALGEIRSEV